MPLETLGNDIIEILVTASGLFSTIHIHTYITYAKRNEAGIQKN